MSNEPLVHSLRNTDTRLSRNFNNALKIQLQYQETEKNLGHIWEQRFYATKCLLVCRARSCPA